MKVIQIAERDGQFVAADVQLQLRGEQGKHLVEIVPIDRDRPAIPPGATAEITSDEDAKWLVRTSDVCLARVSPDIDLDGGEC